jgi:hypothetical protein
MLPGWAAGEKTGQKSVIDQRINDLQEKNEPPRGIPGDFSAGWKDGWVFQKRNTASCKQQTAPCYPGGIFHGIFVY